tara:strand:+ start:1694 stop:1861 length:168 start_codon:yes stop_codon:yes gene_type:complete
MSWKTSDTIGTAGIGMMTWGLALINTAAAICWLGACLVIAAVVIERNRPHRNGKK